MALVLSAVLSALPAVSKRDGCFVCDVGNGIHCYGRQL